MERKHTGLKIFGGLALSLAAVTSACSTESAKVNKTYPTSEPTSNVCLDKNLATIKAENSELKSATEKKLNETIEYMKCSSVEPLVRFADKLRQLQIDGYLVFDEFSKPESIGVEPGNVARATFYGGFPTTKDSSYRMTIDLNSGNLAYEDIAIFLYKETIVLDALNQKAKNATNAGTKIAAQDQDRDSIECAAWLKALTDVGIPLKGQIEVEAIKSTIDKYELHDPESIINCIDTANLN